MYYAHICLGIYIYIHIYIYTLFDVNRINFHLEANIGLHTPSYSLE